MPIFTLKSTILPNVTRQCWVIQRFSTQEQLVSYICLRKAQSFLNSDKLKWDMGKDCSERLELGKTETWSDFTGGFTFSREVGPDDLQQFLPIQNSSMITWSFDKTWVFVEFRVHSFPCAVNLLPTILFHYHFSLTPPLSTPLPYCQRKISLFPAVLSPEVIIKK